MALAIACLLLWPLAAEAAARPASLTMTVVRPDEHTLDVLFVATFENDTDAAQTDVQLPLPAGYTDVRFAMAPNPAAMQIVEGTAIDPTPLPPGESRPYVYRAALALPAEGTRLSVILPWHVSEVTVLVDGQALRVLPSMQFKAAGDVELEGRLLEAYRFATAGAGTEIGLALSPGDVLSVSPETVRPSRWERLQANLGGRPAAFMLLAVAVGLAFWATVAWRRQHVSPAKMAEQRQQLVRHIAALDLQAGSADGPPPGYEDERERLFAKLEHLSRAQEEQQT